MNKRTQIIEVIERELAGQQRSKRWLAEKLGHSNPQNVYNFFNEKFERVNLILMIDICEVLGIRASDVLRKVE